MARAARKLLAVPAQQQDQPSKEDAAAAAALAMHDSATATIREAQSVVVLVMDSLERRRPGCGYEHDHECTALMLAFDRLSDGLAAMDGIRHRLTQRLTEGAEE